MNIKDIVKNIDKKEIPEMINLLEAKASEKIKNTIKGTAIFKAKIKEGRIEVPEVEQDALKLEDEDIVQVIVKKLDK